MLREISQNSQENICNGISFGCSLVNFAKFARTPFLQNSSRQLLLIMVVSIVAKEVLANQTVNYKTKTKAYVLIWARSLKLLKRHCKKGSPGERTGFRSRCSQTLVFLKIRCSKVLNKLGVLKNLVNSTGKHLCWSLFLINLQA